MPLKRKQFFWMIGTSVSVWLGVFLLLSWASPDVRAGSPDDPVPTTAFNFAASRPMPLVMGNTSDESLLDEQLHRQEIRAMRCGKSGGMLECGPARLVVPQNALTRPTYFLLENYSNNVPRVELDLTKSALVLSPALIISYAGSSFDTPLFDASQLKIFREIGLGIYERVPSQVDIEGRCVTSAVTESGHYIIG